MLLGGNVVGVAGGYSTLRQVDLAGNTLRETNIHAINAKLAAMQQAANPRLRPRGQALAQRQHGRPGEHAEDRHSGGPPGSSATW